MELGNILNLSYRELAKYTNNFCKKNYLSHFQFGKLYRGKIEQAELTRDVLVKIWEVPKMYTYIPGDNEKRLMDEVILLSHELIISRPGMIKLYGLCFEGDHLGVVYDLDPFDSLYNLIPIDGFSWLQRIKVALSLACVLKCLHTARGPLSNPFIVRNLDCAHILLDEDYNAKLCDFGLITGGIFPDRTIYTCHHVIGSHGYIDACAFVREDSCPKQDVFAFGVILMNLISKRVYNVEDEETMGPHVSRWANTLYDAFDDCDDSIKRPRFSLVHPSLASDPDFVEADEHKISLLAIECTRGWNYERPTMKQVLRMEPLNIQKFTYDELAGYADSFTGRNYIGHFQFGEFYRASIDYVTYPNDMMVKIWKDAKIYNCRPEDHKLRLMKELILLRHEKVINHPAMLKLHGYCSDEEHLGVVYEFKPFASLFNLIPKDGFTWLQRIKAALGLASLLKFLHSSSFTPLKPFTIHNLDAAHIVLDEDYNPKLCDFGLLSGGFFAEKGRYPGDDIIGCYGYTDLRPYNKGHCSTKNDVFAFGVILLSLISKRVFTEEDRLAGEPYVYQWALSEAEAFESDADMKGTTFSLVHKSIAAEHNFYPDDGYKITMLALDCVNEVESRPAMKQVYRALLKLEAVKQHAEFLGVKKESSPSKVTVDKVV